MKTAIVIPAHNEENRIGKTLESYLNYFRQEDVTLIIVLNACKDNTKLEVSKVKSKKIKILEFERGGKGFAVIEGFKYCLKNDFEAIGFVDADLATTPEEYEKLREMLRECDGVIANRYDANSVIRPKNSLRRLIAKRLFNFVVRSILLLPYRDTQCGAKIFKREVVENIIPEFSMSHWGFDVEMLYLAHKKGFIVREIPTVWINREGSKINFWSAGPMMVLGVIRLRIMHSPIKRFVELYDFIVRKLT